MASELPGPLASHQTARVGRFVLMAAEIDKAIERWRTVCMPPEKAPERWCTVCMLADKKVLAKFVASGPEDIPGHPMQWFDCGEHDNDAHPCYPDDPRFQRMTLEPIDQWFKRNGLC